MWSARSVARTYDVDLDESCEMLAGEDERGGARPRVGTGRVGAAWVGLPPL
jgi:hypothetical protein